MTTSYTITSVSRGIHHALSSGLSSSVPLLPKSFIGVLSKVLAGQHVLLHKYASWMFLQFFVAHASFKETTVLGKKIRPLVEWGRLIGVGDPTAAVRAELVVTVTVLQQTGTLPAGATLLRTPTGVLYTSINPVTLSAATVPVTVRATFDPFSDAQDGAGTIGNLAAGDELSFASPPAQVARVATVASTTKQGAEAETENSYRRRVLRRFQQQPKGGAPANYQEWGEEAANVKRVYPYKSPRPGEIDLYVEASTDIDVDGVPTSTELAAVFYCVQFSAPGMTGLPDRRPAGAAINTLPITRTEFEVTVFGLEVQDGVAQSVAEGKINGALDELLRSREPYIEGLSPLPRQDRITLGTVSALVNDVVDGLGASITGVELVRNTVPITAWELRPGEKAKLGNGGLATYA